MWKTLTKDEKDLMAKIYEENPCFQTASALAEQINVNPNSLQRRLQEHLEERSEFRKILGKQQVFSPTILVSDNFLVTSDWELPDTSGWYLDLLYLLGEKFHLPLLVHAGDVQANDQVGLTTHPVNSGHAKKPYGDVLKMTKAIFRKLAKQYDDKIVIPGNHDDRLARASSGQLTTELVYDLMDIDMASDSHLWVKMRRGWVYIAHPGRYAKSSLALGRQYYATKISPDGTKFHVVIGHTHNPESGLAIDGSKYNIFGLGCGRDPNLTEYSTRASLTYGAWGQSVLMALDGHFHHLVAGMTDFRYYLGDKTPKALL